MPKLFTQCNLNVFKSQKEYLDTLLCDVNEKTKLWFFHLLNCQLNKLSILKEGDLWLGVPISWKFKQKFFQGANIAYLISKGLVIQSGYNQFRHFCRAYKIADEVINIFSELATTEILSKKGLEKRTFNLVDALSISSSSVIKLNRFKFKQEKEVAFNAFGIIAGLRAIESELNNTKNINKKVKLKLRLNHNVRCFQSMLSRTTFKDFKSGIFKYVPEYIEPVKGCRLYEIGGGYLNLSKELRSYSMSGANTINVDAIKCHVTIAHQELTKIVSTSGLEHLINNEINLPGLTPQTVKIAFLAVLNGARIPRKLNKVKSKNRFTIQKLIQNDDYAKDISYMDQLKLLILLGNLLSKFAKKISSWMKTCKSFSKMAKTSENLQRLERKYLKNLHIAGGNTQHDGAVLDIAFLNKLKQLSNKLEIELKPMSNVEAVVSMNNVLLYNQALRENNKSVVIVDSVGYASVINSSFPINHPPSDEIASIKVFKANSNDYSIINIKDAVAKAYAATIDITIKSIAEEYLDENNSLFSSNLNLDFKI